MTRSRHRARNLVHRAAVARGWMFQTDAWEYGIPKGRVRGRRDFHRYGLSLVTPAHPWTRGSRMPPAYLARLMAIYATLPEGTMLERAPGRRYAKVCRQVEAAYRDSGL